MKPLGQLLADSLPPGDPLADLPVAGLSADSRSIAEGFLFAALAGVKADGARFAQDAAARGAVAVVAARDAELGACPLPVVRVDDPRRALALAAAAFYGRQPEIAVAVTGTSGKTSVADFTRQIFTRLGHKAASVGTIGVVRPDGSVYGGLTTPDPVTLHRTLAELADEGIAHLAFEASSHGLDQHRLDGVRLKAAAFTNLGRDHMDYHPTVEHYLGAKLRLFELVERGGPAVINNDDAHADAAIAAARRNGLTVKTVGRKRGSSLFLQSAEREGFQQILRVHFAYGSKILRFPLLGAYQVENALVAASLAALDSERTLAASLDALEYLKGVPGRLEVVGEARGGLAVVDYAHKPEALAAVLASLRPFATGKLICVFGCGGDRDKGKRPIMGDIAVNQADVVIVTDDNPRSEDPATIRAEILAAARGAREIGDRAEAIRTAVGLMGEGDVLVVAGKGHETGQLVAGRTLPFSDREELEKALGEIAA